ncbi:MAG: PD40 domain-containing protein [Bacteroidia bacterium]|nr:PD40 domain-containing protein [Bacteroidia bacterium]
MKTIFLILIAILFSALSGFCQPNVLAGTDLDKQAEKDWQNNNYKLAAASYERLIALTPNNVEYNYRFGISNFLAGFDNNKSLKSLEPLIGNSKAPIDVCYWVAQNYMYLYQFNDAIDMFNTFLTTTGADKVQVAESKRFVEMCNSAIVLMNKPVNVSFQNLGSNINSSSNDYNPFVPRNEEFLIYTSDKKFDQVTKMFDHNLYISYPENNSWSFSKPMQYINTDDNERSVGLSNDGKKLFVCGSYQKSYSEVDMALLKSKLFKFETANDWFHPLAIKTSNGACISTDNNTVYISRENNEGGIVNSDIYIVRKLPNGTWGPLKNLGDIINSPYDETCPNISPDGKMLYFASKGHNSMGGYDLFVSYINEITGDWTTPVNLGYPINTPGDDLTISFSANRRYAYLSSIRKEGMGGQDIYRVTFKDVDDLITVVKGKIVIANETGTVDWNLGNEDLDISVYDLKQNLFGKYIYNTHMGRFIAALPIGEYQIVIHADGYNDYSEKITVLDRDLYQSETDKIFSLSLKKM